jgi:anti-sigma regulatory factor (Ser/Thr protein kinase)
MQSTTDFAALLVPRRVEWIRLATGFVVTAARTMEVPAAAGPLFEVAIAEALNNAVEHPAAGAGASLVCEVECVAQRLIVRLLHRGPGFELPRMPRLAWNPYDTATVPDRGFGLPIIRTVFPIVRTIERQGECGLEIELTF